MRKKNKSLIQFVLILSFIYSHSYTQDKFTTSENIKQELANDYKVADSLLHASYEELQNSFFKNNNEIDIAKSYAKVFLDKAKAEQNKIKIADGYHLYFYISNPKTAMKYVDSIINLTRNLNSINYPSRGYLNKGVLLQNNKKYNEAFEYYLKAKNIAETNNNISHKIAATLNIAQLKISIGKEEEALNVLKSNYAFLKKQNLKPKFFRHYIGTLIGLSSIYNRQKLSDSAKIYINEGLEQISKNKEKYGYFTLLLNSGICDYQSGRYQSAIDSLQKVLRTSKKLEHNIREADAKFFIAKAYSKINEPEKSYEYLKEVDRIVDSTNYSPLLRGAFEMLLSRYKKRNNVEKQLALLEKMILLDSVANKKNNKLNIEIHQKYDTQKLINEKNLILAGLKRQENNNWIISILFGIILAGFSFFFYRNYKRGKYYKKRFDLLMNNQEIENNKEIVSNDTPTKIDLPEEVVQEILSKINVFERDKKFIDSKITLAKLAKKMGTNSTYLSKVINHYKGQNFANYLNGLRIDYAIDQVKNNPNFRKYTIKSIGEEVGFNSVQSFTKAFHKKTGIKPSYFMKTLENIDNLT